MKPLAHAGATQQKQPIFSGIDEDNPPPLDDDLMPQIDHETPTNATEFHQESPDPSSPHDYDDEPPSMDSDAVVQTQHGISPQQSDAVPPSHTQTRQHAPPQLIDDTPPRHAASASATAVTTATTTIDVIIALRMAQLIQITVPPPWD